MTSRTTESSSPEASTRELGWIRALGRSLAVQGAWNFRSMLGHGLGYSLTPLLRDDLDEETLEETLERHTEPFNAHPYFATLAVGAIARLEAEGTDPMVIRRLKAALGPSLGATGDALIWAALLPTCLLFALILGLLEVVPWICVTLFLLLYNTCHIAVRIWALHTGFDAGFEVSRRIRDANLPAKTNAVRRLGTVFVGMLTAILVAAPPVGVSTWLWMGIAGSCFAIGVVLGERAWRPTALVVVGVVIVTTVFASVLA